MNFKSTLGYKLFGLVLLLVSTKNASASSTEVNITCPDCSTSQMQNKAYTHINFHPQFFLAGDYIVNVLDSRSFDVKSFHFYKEEITAGDVTTYTIGKVPTSSRIKEASTKLKLASAKITSAVSSGNIPDTVISDPWDFVNCFYCTNRVEQFLRENAQFERGVTMVDNIFKTLNITATALLNVYEVQLDAGGRIRFTLEITNSGDLLVKVNQVIDKGDNTIPFRAQDLKNGRVWVLDNQHAKDINQRISIFEFYVPISNVTGSVVITDIPDGFCDSLDKQTKDQRYPWCNK